MTIERDHHGRPYIRPDADSRFPTMYCKTCGGGWLTFTKCDRDQWKGNDSGPHCDFTGDILSSEDTANMMLQAAREIMKTPCNPHDSGKYPDCGAFNDCKPGCPSRLVDISTKWVTGVEWPATPSSVGKSK